MTCFLRYHALQQYFLRPQRLQPSAASCGEISSPPVFLIILPRKRQTLDGEGQR